MGTSQEYLQFVPCVRDLRHETAEIADSRAFGCDNADMVRFNGIGQIFAFEFNRYCGKIGLFGKHRYAIG